MISPFGHSLNLHPCPPASTNMSFGGSDVQMILRMQDHKLSVECGVARGRCRGPPIRSAPIGVWRRLQVKINIHTCSSRTCRGYVGRTRSGRLSDLPTKGAPTRTTVKHVKVFGISSGSSNGQQQQQPLERTRSGSALAVAGGADAACCSGWATSVALGRPYHTPTHSPTHSP